MHRLITRPAPGMIAIEQRTLIAGSAVGIDASGPACIYAHVRVRRGTVAYVRDGVRVPAPTCFHLWMPPFTVVEASLEACDVMSAGLAFRVPRDLALPAGPVIVPDAKRQPLHDPADVLAWIAAVREGQCVARASRPSPMAARAKAVIDGAYENAIAIGAVARRLRTSPAQLSREFRTTFGMPPVRYRHHVRVIDALTRLADGVSPMAASLDVGFGDLSRFYKVFGRIACGAPGTYRSASSKNAKTPRR